MSITSRCLLTEGLIPIYVKRPQTAATRLVARYALKEAWFNAKDARGDFSFIDIDFWNPILRDVSTDSRSEKRPRTRTKRLNKWQRELWLFARRFDDQYVFTNPLREQRLFRSAS